MDDVSNETVYHLQIIGIIREDDVRNESTHLTELIKRNRKHFPSRYDFEQLMKDTEILSRTSKHVVMSLCATSKT